MEISRTVPSLAKERSIRLKNFKLKRAHGRLYMNPSRPQLELLFKEKDLIALCGVLLPPQPDGIADGVLEGINKCRKKRNTLLDPEKHGVGMYVVEPLLSINISNFEK